MTTKELIETLRDESNCNVLDYVDEAADRLEELVAELEDERYRHDRYVDFELAEAAELQKLKKRIKMLEKSNRNWRRKAQRLRNSTHGTDS